MANMIVFDRCCCCVPLRTGCLILGYLNLIGDIILAIMSIMGISAGVSLHTSNFKDGGVGAGLIAISTITLVFVLILLVFTIRLVIGLHKEKPGYVKGYLICAVVFLVIHTLTFVVRCATLAADVFQIIGTIIEILLSIYFLLVIRSHYFNMRGTTNNV